MDHHGGVFGHDNLVAGHSDDARDARRYAVNVDRGLGFVALQRGVNRRAVKDRAATGIDKHVDSISIKSAQSCDKLAGSDITFKPLVRYDVAVDVKLSASRRIISPCLCLEF